MSKGHQRNEAVRKGDKREGLTHGWGWGKLRAELIRGGQVFL